MSSKRDWLDVGSAAVVEVTSEDGAFPVESALLQGEKRGWRASGPGPLDHSAGVRQTAKAATDLAEV